VARKPLQYETGFTVLPGTYVVKVLARDATTGRVLEAFRRRNLRGAPSSWNQTASPVTSTSPSRMPILDASMRLVGK